MEKLKTSLKGFLKKHKKQICFYLLLNSCFAIFITLSSYIHIPLSNIKDHFVYVIHFFLLQFTVSGIIFLFTLNKWLFRLLFTPIFLILSLFSYWVYTQDISITVTLIQSILETKPSIIVDVMSFQYVIYFILILVVLYFLNKKYNNIGGVVINIPFAIIAIFSIFSYYVIEEKRLNTLRSRLPYSAYYGIINYYKKSDYIITTPPKNIKSFEDSLKVVLVLGETVRADHLQLNGYKRNTTPLLNNRTNLISFNNIHTPHTNTSTSLPRIITNLGVNDNKTDSLITIFDIFKKCDFKTFWIGNQELEKSYGPLVKTNDKIILVDSLRSVFSFNKALDNKLLLPFKNTIFHDSKGLYSLHMIGSHWWYENRYTEKFRKYKPVIDSKYIPSLKAQQLINSYDNTIIYLDNFLNEVISIQEKLKVPTILIYISDHGEILGEDNKWLHSQESEAVKNPALIVWYSNSFAKKYPEKVKALFKNKNLNFTTDVVYASLLDLLNIQGINNYKKDSFFNKLR